MEKILIALFGGGTLDWEDISRTNYDWGKIFSRLKDEYGYGNDFRNVDINTIYREILEMALEDIEEMFENCSDEKFKHYLECNVKVQEDFEIYANCLNSYLIWMGDQYIGEKISEFFKDEIEEINNKIGFTYIDFD